MFQGEGEGEGDVETKESQVNKTRKWKGVLIKEVQKSKKKYL